MIRTGVYVRSKGKPGRPPMSRAERGRLGGIALKEKRLNGTVEIPKPTPLPSAFVIKDGEVWHGRCKKVMYFQRKSCGRSIEMEILFYCLTCRETVPIPVAVLAEALCI